MVNLQLVEIGRDGNPAENLPLTDITRSVSEAMTNVYRQSGFVRPWIGYFAVQDGRIIGTCGFKSPPQGGRVEIAYGTLGDEGRGIATQMARHLIEMARADDISVRIVAQTLPEESASTTILRKLGFSHTATVQHATDGEVWEWSLPEATNPQTPIA